MTSVQTVCIVGAGPAGLVATKSCLEEKLLPFCFEQNSEIGGKWNYRDDLLPRQGERIYKFSLTRHSKSMMGFSDFPFSKETPMFPNHTHATNYLNEYAEHFDLTQHVRLKSRVTSIKEINKIKEKGKYEVEVEGSDWNTTIQVFDAVILCTGFNDMPYVPELEGQEHFNGVISHSHTFTTPDLYTGRNVIVAGPCDTAGEIASALTPTAGQIYLSVGDGCWVYPSITNSGEPFDCIPRRALHKIPIACKQKYLTYQANAGMNHVKYGLHPLNVTSRFLTSEELKFKAATGKIKIISGVNKMNGFDVELKDGSTISDVDSIILCTGYDEDLGLLDSPIRAALGDVDDAYHTVIPFKAKHRRVNFVGRNKIPGRSYWPLFELQARLAARGLNGKFKLTKTEGPRCELSKMDMVEIQTCLDSIAEDIGVMPTFKSVASLSIGEAMRCTLGPPFPSQYRLLGDHTWKGARASCKKAYDNMFTGIKHRDTKRAFIDEYLTVIISVFLGILAFLIVIYF